MAHLRGVCGVIAAVVKYTEKVADVHGLFVSLKKG